MNFNINPGKLRHQITIQQKTTSKNEDKIPIDVWKNKYSTRAKIKNIRGSEFIEALGVNSKMSKTFYIRGSRGIKINNSDRVIYNKQAYNIIYVNDIEDRGIWIEIRCEKVEN